MEKNLDAITVARKTGNERFRLGTQPTEFNLLGFWQWMGSDLTNNTYRGMLAEYIVACDLGVHTGTRTEWDAFDLVTSEGIKVEVKSAAYVQSWFQKKHSYIKFKICSTIGWDAQTNTYGEQRKRQADVYVFCLLKHKEKATLNPLDLSQWDFFVLPTAVLNEKLPEKESIALSSLLRLNPVKVDFGAIGATIHNLFSRGGL